MKRILQLIIKFVAYTAAAIVILLAVLVGLFRLFLPQLTEYQEEIKVWASEAIGMQVEFTGMDARWGLSGPELKFYGTELIRPSTQTRALAASEVGVGVSLIRLLSDRTLVVDTVTIRDTSIEIRQLEDGSWRIQGSDIDELLAIHSPNGNGIGRIEVIVEDVELQLIHPGDSRPTFIDVPNLLVQSDEVRVAVDADVRFDESIGDRMTVSATRIKPAPDETSPWNLTVEANDLNLAGLIELYPQSPKQVESGRGDIDLSVAILGTRVASATADLDLDAVSLEGEEPFDVSGRIEWNSSAGGWLFAADDVDLVTPRGAWPRTSVRVEAETDRERNILSLEVAAEYLDLADTQSVGPWLAEEQRILLDSWRPDGIIQDLELRFGDRTTGDFFVSASLSEVGIASVEGRPGLRGFTGDIRADTEGGRLEIASDYAVLSAPGVFNEPVEIDLIEGTVIWRRSGTQLTVLSDSIAFRTPIIESESSVEITLEDGGSPFVDLSSTWSVSDLAAFRRYLPEPIMRPKMYLWFQQALLGGSIPRARTTFYGSLADFPFSNGNGRSVTEASVRDFQFRYNPQFPVAEIFEAEVLLDNTRLFSDTNRSQSLGNRTVDARIEIADLLNPVFTMQSYTEGTMESLHDFSSNSPIDRVFGGNLDRIAVSGNGSVALDLTVPIRNWRTFTFTSTLRADDATLEIAGLPAAISEINGSVTMDRENVSSEELTGTFLSEPVSFTLRNSTMPDYRVVGSMFGVAGAEALVAELGVPLEGRLEGSSNYRVDVLFPRRRINLDQQGQGAAQPEAPPAEPERAIPLMVRASSDLNGLAVDLPPPYGKPAEQSRNVSGEVLFMPGGEQVRVSGEAESEFAWQLDFMRIEEGPVWDFDRGVLILGDSATQVPDVRGLHVRGQLERFDLAEWFALGRGGEAGSGAVERIRSIDIQVGDLYLLGQHLEDHRVKVDRSARDWLVQFDGEQMLGSAFVPYEFTAERELVLDMERLILPGRGEGEEGGEQAIDDEVAGPGNIDPRALPAISLTAAEFAIGNRYLGAVEASFVRTTDGLVADSIVATDPSFEIVGNGGWEADPDDPLGSVSSLTATLTSSDVETTMRRLDYEPGIDSDDMAVLFDLSWSGGPRMDFFDTLDGDIQLRLGTGQLREVEPGAGRMFGLMSVVALPRRLSLDFRDVFESGFGFDEISGSFVIEDGVARTCDLALSGPAADIGIIGSVDLVNRDYNQTAIVSPSVGNTLPVVGLVAGGPQGAAVMFLFSQIFKEPLQGVGQVYYSVAGSWDEPAIESTDAETFTANGRSTGCLAEGG